MTSKNRVVILYGVLWLFTGLLFVSGQEECASNVSDCVTVAFGVFTNHADDVPRVCKATDDFLMCIVKETQTCDPLVAASIKDSMSPMIEIYTADPYNCQLESAKNDAFKPDLCSEEMSTCSVHYYQAQSEANVDYNRACKLFEGYLDCMESNTTSCESDMRTFINEHSTNTTKEFDKGPLYCEERLQYPLDEVDANFTACNNILQSMDIQYARQDYVCRTYQEFFNCSVQALTRASPRQFQTYIQQVNSVSETFRTMPYFCESDQPCMELFKACNQSAYNPSMAPCQFMEVYTSCLSSANQFCGEADYITLATNTQIMIGELHNTYNCIEENMNKRFDATTPAQDKNKNDNMKDDNVDDKDDGIMLPDDKMYNDGPVADTDHPTPEPENDSSPSKTDDTKTEVPTKVNGDNGGSDVKPETDKNDDVITNPANDGSVTETKSEKETEKPAEEGNTSGGKPQNGAGSGSNTKTPGNYNKNENYDNNSSVLKGSLWLMLFTFCLMIV